MVYSHVSSSVRSAASVAFLLPLPHRSTPRYPHYHGYIRRICQNVEELIVSPVTHRSAYALHPVDILSLMAVFDICFAFYQLLQFCDALRLLSSIQIYPFAPSKSCSITFSPPTSFSRLFQHDPVVGSQIWLTFCTIDQNVFDLFPVLSVKVLMSRNPAPPIPTIPAF